MPRNAAGHDELHTHEYAIPLELRVQSMAVI